MATSVNFLFLPYRKREPETAFFTEHLLMNASKKQQQFKSRFDKLFEKRSSHRRCSTKKGFLKISQYSHNIPVLESLFNKVAGLKAEVLSCKYFEIFKSTYFEEHLRTSALWKNTWEEIVFHCWFPFSRFTQKEPFTIIHRRFCTYFQNNFFLEQL